MSAVKYNRLKITNLKVVSSDVVTIISNMTERQKILTSDIQAGDNFGNSISVNAVGNTAIIGANFEDTGGSNAGAAYIFTKNSSDVWSQKQKIQSSDIQAGDNFGHSVSINGIGDTVIVGARNEDTSGSNAGSAYIFTKNSSDIWNQKQKIQASDPAVDDIFGNSVAINYSGNILLVGAPGSNTGASDAGAVYIFTKNSSDIWSQKQKIQASDLAASAFFGNSVTTNDLGDIISVGAFGDSAIALNAGAAYIFTKNSSDIWNQKQKIQASDAEAGDRFGDSMSINALGNTIIIGASQEDTGSSNRGSAYIFTKNSSDIWSEKQKIQASDNVGASRFGTSVGINSNGSAIIVGAYRDNSGLTSAGAAHLFTKNSSDIWIEQQKIRPIDIEASDRFGTFVAINSTGNTVLASSSLEDTGGLDAGAVYIFTGTVSDSFIGGVSFSDVALYELYVMKSDNVINYKI